MPIKHHPQPQQPLLHAAPSLSALSTRMMVPMARHHILFSSPITRAEEGNSSTNKAASPGAPTSSTLATTGAHLLSSHAPKKRSNNAQHAASTATRRRASQTLSKPEVATTTSTNTSRLLPLCPSPPYAPTHAISAEMHTPETDTRGAHTGCATEKDEQRYHVQQPVHDQPTSARHEQDRVCHEQKQRAEQQRRGRRLGGAGAMRVRSLLRDARAEVQPPFRPETPLELARRNSLRNSRRISSGSAVGSVLSSSALSSAAVTSARRVSTTATTPKSTHVRRKAAAATTAVALQQSSKKTFTSISSTLVPPAPPPPSAAASGQTVRTAMKPPLRTRLDTLQLPFSSSSSGVVSAGALAKSKPARRSTHSSVTQSDASSCHASTSSFDTHTFVFALRHAMATHSSPSQPSVFDLLAELGQWLALPGHMLWPELVSYFLTFMNSMAGSGVEVDGNGTFLDEDEEKSREKGEQQQQQQQRQHEQAAQKQNDESDVAVQMAWIVLQHHRTLVNEAIALRAVIGVLLHRVTTERAARRRCSEEQERKQRVLMVDPLLNIIRERGARLEHDSSSPCSLLSSAPDHGMHATEMCDVTGGHEKAAESELKLVTHALTILSYCVQPFQTTSTLSIVHDPRAANANSEDAVVEEDIEEEENGASLSTSRLGEELCSAAVVPASAVVALARRRSSVRDTHTHMRKSSARKDVTHDPLCNTAGNDVGKREDAARVGQLVDRIPRMMHAMRDLAKSVLRRESRLGASAATPAAQPTTESLLCMLCRLYRHLLLYDTAKTLEQGALTTTLTSILIAYRRSKRVVEAVARVLARVVFDPAGLRAMTQEMGLLRGMVDALQLQLRLAHSSKAHDSLPPARQLHTQCEIQRVHDSSETNAYATSSSRNSSPCESDAGIDKLRENSSHDCGDAPAHHDPQCDTDAMMLASSDPPALPTSPVSVDSSLALLVSRLCGVLARLGEASSVCQDYLATQGTFLLRQLVRIFVPLDHTNDEVRDVNRAVAATELRKREVVRQGVVWLVGVAAMSPHCDLDFVYCMLHPLTSLLAAEDPTPPTRLTAIYTLMCLSNLSYFFAALELRNKENDKDDEHDDHASANTHSNSINSNGDTSTAVPCNLVDNTKDHTERRENNISGDQNGCDKRATVSRYPLAAVYDVLGCILAGVLFDDDVEATVEATRILGNMSFTNAGRDWMEANHCDEAVLLFLGHEDMRVVYNCFGIVLNLTATTSCRVVADGALLRTLMQHTARYVNCDAMTQTMLAEQIRHTKISAHALECGDGVGGEDEDEDAQHNAAENGWRCCDRDGGMQGCARPEVAGGMSTVSAVAIDGGGGYAEQIVDIVQKVRANVDGLTRAARSA